MNLVKDAPAEAPVSRAAWMALIAALLGWMFDGAEMGVFSLVGRAAVMDLLNTKDDDLVRVWISIVNAGFLVGAATGGVVFGWLGDRIGRVRAMTLSVLTYALFTGVCGFCQEAWQVLLLRFIAALGMGGEWSLGVALVMEVWPNKSRAFMAGLIGAAANVGYLLVGFVGLGLTGILEQLAAGMRGIGMPADTVTMLTGNTGWRIIMILGTLPALLTFFIRTFVPESEKWEKENASGNTSNWASVDLIAVLIGLAGPLLIIAVWSDDGSRYLPEANRASWLWITRGVSTLLGLAIAVVCYSYPVLRYCQRIEASTNATGFSQRTFRRMLLAACLSGVALLGTWGSTQNVPNWADEMSKKSKAAEVERLTAAGETAAAEALAKKNLGAREYALIAISAGAIVGTLIAAWLGNFMGRRPTYCLLCFCSMLSIFYLFVFHKQYDSSMLFAAFLAGTCTAAFYGWLPLYLPELFNTNVRATGQGFGFNFGRVLAAIGTLQIVNLLSSMKSTFSNGVNLGSLHIEPGWPVVCSMLSTIYLIGMIIIWFAPETNGQELPE
jgi:MFS family permease